MHYIVKVAYFWTPHQIFESSQTLTFLGKDKLVSEMLCIVRMCSRKQTMRGNNFEAIYQEKKLVWTYLNIHQQYLSNTKILSALLKLDTVITQKLWVLFGYCHQSCHQSTSPNSIYIYFMSANMYFMIYHHNQQTKFYIQLVQQEQLSRNTHAESV